MDFKRIPFGELDAFNVIVEIPKGSSNKYEYDGDLDAIKLDYVFPDNFVFRYNYGFVPRTRSADGDCLDAVVLSSYPIEQGCIIQAKAVGIMDVLDRGAEDHKLLVVPLVDPLAQKYNDVTDLPKTLLKDLTDFFHEIGKLKNKDQRVRAIHDRQTALNELKAATKRK